MYTNKPEIFFHYNKTDRGLFDSAQKEHWKSIEGAYKKLSCRCKKEITMPIQATHKEWITSRVNSHINESVIRLLYLTEAFCEESKKFNTPAAAVLIKSMVEIPLHMGYLLWIVSENHSFEKIRKELAKIAFGNRDKNTGLTTTSKITGKEMYEKADSMMEKIFKEESQKSTIKIFETLYKQSNTTGHHNYEARMLCGLTNNSVWKVKDRKEQFQFFTNKLFQLFLHCDTILGIASIFWNATDHYTNQIPDLIKNEQHPQI